MAWANKQYIVFFFIFNNGASVPFRINKQSLDLDPVVTDEITHLQITGVSYLGNKLNFTFTKSVTTVELTSAHGNPKDSLVISFDQLTPDLPLYIGTLVHLSCCHILLFLLFSWQLNKNTWWKHTLKNTPCFAKYVITNYIIFALYFFFAGQPVSFPMKAAHIHTKSTCV